MSTRKSTAVGGYRTIEFPSRDGLVITADYYPCDPPGRFIVLCHRSHCNRAEYRETASRLVQLGFCCLAIDQRSGMNVFGETNETAARAKQRGLPTGYADAKVDIEAAIDHAFELNGRTPIILLGSSYSASLALVCAVGNDRVSAVVAFSPGEFLKGVSVQEKIAALLKPVFVTSTWAETEGLSMLVRRVKRPYLWHYKPTVNGFHGSKTLWKSVDGSALYWAQLEKFLAGRAT